jgi:HTH-type transcriptional regulator/antitoxin HigA
LNIGNNNLIDSNGKNRNFKLSCHAKGFARQQRDSIYLHDLKFKKRGTMDIKPIKAAKDYKQAMTRLEQIFDARPGTNEGDELEILALLIEKYENEKFPIEAPDPIEAIKFRMEQLGYKQRDLEDIIGYKGRVSEILNKKRKLTLEMIRKIHDALNIPAEVLVKEY